jgi:hypothetical protein
VKSTVTGKHPLSYDVNMHGLLGGHSVALVMINSAELKMTLNSESFIKLEKLIPE